MPKYQIAWKCDLCHKLHITPTNVEVGTVPSPTEPTVFERIECYCPDQPEHSRFWVTPTLLFLKYWPEAPLLVEGVK